MVTTQQQRSGCVIGLLILTELICGVYTVLAQNPGSEWLKKSTAEARMNLAVPDAPAYKILDDNPSNILRPGTMQEVALLAAGFAQSGGVLPKTFAVEVAPAMILYGSSLTLSQYRESPFLYRLRFSAASRRLDDNLGGTEASIGFRMTLFDDADPRCDQKYLEQLSGIALKIVKDVRATNTGFSGSSGRIQKDSSEQMKKYEDLVDRLRTERKDSLWNASVIEWGTAAKYHSPDSLIRGVRVGKYAGWLSASWPIGSYGQFLFGLSSTLERNASGRMDSSSFGMTARFYAGSNRLKMFGEVQIRSMSNSSSYQLVSLGGEMNVISSSWVEFSLGFEKRGIEQSTLSTSFSVHWSLPEMISQL
ncbi:MAG: hypothetical protein V1799_01555 [bacterium]